MTCVPKHSSDISIVKKSNKIFSNSFLLGASERSNDASNCDNNCEIELFESDLSLSPLTTAQLDSKIDLGSLVNYFDYISQPSTASDLQVKCKAFLSAYDRMISFFEPNLTTPSTYLNDRNISQFTLPDAIDFTSVIILKLSFVETLLSEGLTNFTNVTYLDIISTEMATNLNSIGQFCNSTHWFNNSLCSVGNIFDTINCMESERSDNSTIAEACKVKIEQLLRQKPSEIWQAYAIELSIFPNILKNLLGDIYKIDSILSTGLLSKNQTAILGALCSDFLVGKNAIGLTNFLSNEYTEFVVVSQVALIIKLIIV